MTTPVNASDFDLQATSDIDYGTEALFSKLQAVKRQSLVRESMVEVDGFEPP